MKKKHIVLFIVISIIFVATGITFALSHTHPKQHNVEKNVDKEPVTSPTECPFCKNPNVIGEEMNGKIFSVKAGEVQFITLECNSSKNYKWYILEKPNTNIALISGPDYEKSDKSTPKKTIEAVFGLTAVKEGLTTLKLQYVNSENKKSILKTFSLTVKVVTSEKK
jgi:predicted secreted protein